MKNDNYSGDDVFDEIEELCERGEELADNGKIRPALSTFWKAFNLLPEPKEQYPAGTWLLVSIGDLNFMVQNYEGGVKNLTEAKKFPEGEGNPFLHFRLGQCQFELGNKEEALKEFLIAFEADGEAVFEDEEPKYWNFFKAVRP